VPRHPSRLAGCVLSLALLLTAAAPASAADPSSSLRPRSVSLPQHPTATTVPGELVVRFMSGTSAATRLRALRAVGAHRPERLGAPNTVLVRLPAAANAGAAIARLEHQPGVAYAEPNYLFRTFATPDDPRFADLWGLSSANDHDIDAPAAWNVTNGSDDVLVAVVDTGVDLAHPDLGDNIWTNPDETDDNVDNDGNGFIDDLHGWDFVGDDPDPHDQNGHGTHVAGTIGAGGNNGQGITGVAWDVSLMSLRAGSASGVLTNANVVAAFTYACDMGAQVVNASFGGPKALAVRDAIAACPDALFVVAAGNEGNNNDANAVYPCAFSQANIVCVAASNRADALASFSNFGHTSVDLAAPGDSILSATPNEVLFADGFESGLTNWDAQHDPSGILWRTTTSVAQSGSRSATDSRDGQYANGSNTWIQTGSPIDLSGGEDCQLDYAVRFDLQTQADWLFVEGRDGGSGPWSFIDGIPHGDFAWTGSTQGTMFDVPNPIEADGFHSPSAFNFRFRLLSNGSVRRDGAYVDDVVLHCLTGSHGADDFVRHSGTSMAAPHVAGVAALLLSAYPDATVAELKAALLDGADPKAGLATKTVSGGRLNARGALDQLDVVRPVASAPTVRLASAGSIGTDTVPLRVSWAASTDAAPSSGIDGYQLWRRAKIGGTWRAWQKVRDTAALSVVVDVAPGISQFRVRARDGGANWSTYKSGAAFTLGDPQGAPAIDFVRTWTSQTSGDFFDGSSRFSRLLDASAAHEFTGRQVAWIASRGPDRGRAKVFINGVLVETINLYAATRRHRQVVFITDPGVAETQTIMIKVISKGGQSSGTRVDVDAFITLN
jgi:subtilisin family serine protease